MNKGIDTAVIGKNYLSAVFALGLKKIGKKILHLEDHRIQEANQFSHGLFLLEASYLSHWGEKFGPNELHNIGPFLKPTPYFLSIDGIHLSLGNRPSENLLELSRKFSHLFPFLENSGVSSLFQSEEGKQQFDIHFHEYCRRMGKALFYYKNLQNLNLNSFTTMAPAILTDIYSLFSRSVENVQNEPEDIRRGMRAFLYLTRGLAHKKFTIKGSDFEFFHLLLCLLSPCYQLEKVELMNSLRKQLASDGHRGELKSWSFHRRYPWAIELDQILGVYTPEKIVFVGGGTQRMPVSIETELRVYQSVFVNWEYNEGHLKMAQGRKILFGGLENMGSSIPACFGEFFDGKAQFELLVRKRPGQRPKFVLPEIRRYLKKILGAEGLKISKESYGLGEDVWVEEERNKVQIYRNRMAKIVDVTICDRSGPETHSILKGVTYFGPIKEMPLGLLSCLMEMHDFLEYH